MALPLKSGADLYNNQALRLRLHNLGADPTEVGAGLIYFNTSTGLNTSQKARLYTGSAWKTIAFSEDLDVASNADFLALKERVDLLSGEVDTDAIISNMKEVSAFLEGFAEDASLMDLLNGKLNTSGGTIDGNLLIGAPDNTSYRYLQFARSGYGSRINIADGNLYVSFGGIDANGGLTATKHFSLGNDGIRYAPDGKTYHDILTSAGGTIKSDSGYMLTLNRLSESPTLIAFQSRGVLKGFLGIDTEGKPVYLNNSAVSHTLLHSGNVGEYAMKNYDNQGATNFNEVFYNGIQYAGSGSSNAPLKDAVLVSFFIYDSSWQIVGGRNNNKLMFRSGTNSPSAWNDWKTIAFTDSDITGNAATATKLATPRTIWGQSFDGTGDISGNLTIGKQRKDYTTQNYLYLWKGDGTYRHRGMLFVSEKGASYDYYNPDAGIYRQLLISPNGLVYNYTDGGSAFLINSSGNVTIGSEDKAGTAAKLYVDGHIKLGASGYLYKNDKTIIDFAGDAPLFGYGTAAAGLGTKVYGSDIRLYYGGTTNVGFILNNSGNVGIGTTDPTEKLHVVGNLHVTGNIIADGEVSAGGAAEEGGNAGGGGAFHSESIAVGATQTTIAHGLGTDDIVVSIYEKDGVSGRWSLILTDVEIVDANNIIVSFGSATSVEHKVVIMGAVA